MSYAKNWVFTEHDVENQDLTKWAENESVQFIQYQLEVAPDTGKEHFQGMLLLKKRMRLSQLKTQFSPTAHWEAMKGTVSQSLSYTSKEDTRVGGPWRFGEVDETGGQGSRADIHELKRKIDSGESLDSIQESNPLFFDPRYVTMARNMLNHKVRRTAMAKLEERYAFARLRPWQQEAVDHLALQSDRHILWICDYEGETGKSFLCQWLLVSQGYQVLGQGKYQDLVYNVEPSAAGYVFDIPAAVKEEFLPYSLMEKIKDGVLVSTKYEGGTKLLNSSKVIVLANIGPDPTKFKKNRLQVYSPVKNLLTGELSLKLLDGFD